MPNYRVSETSFYERFSPVNLAFGWRIEAAVTQIVRRYDLTNKSLLSLGGGMGMEEYYFLQHGNRLTIVDIDENGLIEPVLKTAPSGNLCYFVDDANKVELEEQFGVLFMSGFTPDELRRDEIIRQRDTDTFRRMVDANDGTWEWPWWEDPFHPIVMRFARNLRHGGTMLVQSYCGGLDAIENRYYLGACDRQLAEIGLELREIYRFAETTGSMLYVISRGMPNWPLHPPLTKFHGRAEPERIQCLRLAAPPHEALKKSA